MEVHVLIGSAVDEFVVYGVYSDPQTAENRAKDLGLTKSDRPCCNYTIQPFLLDGEAHG